MKDKYVFDSSVWIALERGDKRVLKIAEPMIRKNQVCLVDVIEAEVLRGARSNKDYNKLSEAFSYFSSLSTSWGRVAKLAFRVAKKGFMPPLIDLYIASAVLENKRVLCTQDKHFQHIKKVVPLKLIML